MQEIDRLSISKYGVPGIVLMEHAGRGTAKSILKALPALNSADKVAIFAGPGNNGGDGFVVARWLASAGIPVLIFLISSSDKIHGDARTNYEIALRLKLSLYSVADEHDWGKYKNIAAGSCLLVDAIFGTGLKREISGLTAEIINWINDLGKPVWSVDIPSGIDADTGRPLGPAVRATRTVTFGLPKLGHVMFPGADHLGQLEIIDIGIPETAVREVAPKRVLLTPDVCRKWLLPRNPDSHKGTYGHALILAGSPGKTGAATLTCLGALRSGAGLVTLGIPRSLNAILEVKLTEAMSAPLPETAEHTLSKAALPEVNELLKGKKVLAVGPGISYNSETQEIIRKLAREAEIPMVIDADGLGAIKDELKDFQPEKIRILTPHPGEMARLTEKNTTFVQQNRISIAEDLARQFGVYVVLKGAATVIAAPDGTTGINTTGAPVLAAGGTGDVLTGLIAGFLAQSYGAFEAACLAVFCHGAAGDLLAKGEKTSGILASEIAEAVPAVMAELRRHNV